MANRCCIQKKSASQIPAALNHGLSPPSDHDIDFGWLVIFDRTLPLSATSHAREENKKKKTSKNTVLFDLKGTV
jgi:hypothetical protein